VRQFGHLPRIIKRCTVNKTQNSASPVQYCAQFISRLCNV